MSLLRRGVELVSRGVVLRRRLPEAFGSLRLYVTPDSALRYWRWNMERVDPILFAWVDELVRPEMKVWDIGANNGLFAFAAAARSGRQGLVLAVEPDPVLVALLRRSVQANPHGCASVAVINAAAADRGGFVEFSIAGRGRATSHLSSVPGSSQAGGTRERMCVPALTLDMLLEEFGPPGLVKIDVEGAEEAVLKGASGLLTVARPFILCEVHDHARDAVSHLLVKAGFSLFDASAPRRLRHPVDRAPWNLLAVPGPGP